GLCCCSRDTLEAPADGGAIVTSPRKRQNGSSMLPDTRDIAALPSSWGLTLWDAMPVYLSIELAVAVAITVLLSGARRQRAWSLASAYPLSSMAYVLLFDLRLALILASALILDAVARLACRTSSPPS